MNNLQRGCASLLLILPLGLSITIAAAEEKTMVEDAAEEKVSLQAKATEPPVLSKKQRQDYRLGQQKLLETGYQFYQEQAYDEAIEPLFTGFNNDLQRPDDNNEWITFFLALTLEKQGFSQASVDLLSQLVMQKTNTQIVSYSLEVFESISRTQAFDKTAIIAQTLLDHDFGFIENPEVKAFIHYHKGLYDWQNGQAEWAEKHFEQLPENNYYQQQYHYHQALVALQGGDVDQALNLLQSLEQDNKLDKKLTDDVLWTTARLLFEQGDFPAAIKRYKKIKTPVYEQASFLLELAWNHYNLAEYEKSLAYLYTFQAPIFKAFFTPEFYILQALIYKEACLYEQADSSINDFFERYQDSFTAIKRRQGATDKNAVALAELIMQRQSIQSLMDYLALLTQEAQKIDDVDNKQLKSYLHRLYVLQQQEVKKDLQVLVDVAYTEEANRLLIFQEQGRLAEYEIAISKFSPAKSASYQAKKKQDVDNDKALVIFDFQGEYWNDELLDYRITLPNACENQATWDLISNADVIDALDNEEAKVSDDESSAVSEDSTEVTP